MSESVFDWRPFHADDFEACLNIFRSHLGTAFRNSEEAEFVEFLRQTGLGIAPEHGSTQYFVGGGDDDPVACGGIARAKEGNAFDLCWGMVHRDHVGAGLGKRLLRKRIEQICESDRAAEVRLITDRSTEPFFARFGFVRVHVQPNGLHDGVDAVRMAAAVSDVARSLCIALP